MQVLTHAAAAVEIDPKQPLGADALREWHDKVGGPKDTNGRRIFTPEVCKKIRAARARSRAQG